MLTRISSGLLLALALTTFGHAQTSLSSLADEANADWMFGEWKASLDNGGTMELKVSWDLGRKMAVLEVQTPDTHAKGFTVLEPGAELPSYFGADDQGSVSRGSWNYEDGTLVLRLETSRSYQSPQKWAAVFAGNASSGLQIRIHGVESWGGLVYPARTTLKFSKK